MFLYILISSQFFYKLLNNNEIEIFKYSGLKIQNSDYCKFLSILTGILITLIFYNLSSNLRISI